MLTESLTENLKTARLFISKTVADYTIKNNATHYQLSLSCIGINIDRGKRSN